MLFHVAPGLEDAQITKKIDFAELGIPGGWEHLLAHWKRVLNRLVREFLAGSATVDPKDPRTTCRYCELHALCRIKEQFDFDVEPERDLAEEDEDDG